MNFDAQNFMNTVYSDAMDDKRILCPAGVWPAQITKIEPRSGTIAKGERTGETWAGLGIQWEITDPSVLALCQRNKVTVFQSIMLDLTPQGGLDFSKQRNIDLGALRTAVNQNNPGQPWSPAMLVGQFAKVRVKHVPGFKNPEVMQAEVAEAVRA